MHTGRQRDQGPIGDILQGGGQDNNDIANNNNNFKTEPENSCPWNVHNASPEKVGDRLLC